MNSEEQSRETLAEALEKVANVDVCNALGNATRARLFYVLIASPKELFVKELHEICSPEKTFTNTANHLRVLERSRLVSARKEENRMYYRANQEFFRKFLSSLSSAIDEVLSGKMLTVDEVAEKLSLTSGRIRHFIYDGRLRASKRGRQWFIAMGDLEAFKNLDRPSHRPRISDQ